MKSYEKIRYEQTGTTGLLTFHSPANLNALDFQMIQEMNSLLDHLEADEKIRVLILTGAGDKAFIAGGDISVQLTFDVQKAYDWACLGHKTLRRLELLPIPVIGAVNGYALGGGMEVALVCDILIASEQARFGLPEVTLAITPGFGGTQRLPRRIGVNRAKELILTGRHFRAEEAKQLGLVSEVVRHDELMQRAFELAGQIASHSCNAVRMCKTAVDEGLQCDLDRGLTMERALFSRCFADERQKEEMRAFVEKKKKK